MGEGVPDVLAAQVHSSLILEEDINDRQVRTRIGTQKVHTNVARRKKKYLNGGGAGAEDEALREAGPVERRAMDAAAEQRREEDKGGEEESPVHSSHPRAGVDGVSPPS